MDYIKDVADIYADHQRHMEWVTPTNWVVLQQYSEMQQKRIKTHISGEVVSLSFPKERTTVYTVTAQAWVVRLTSFTRWMQQR